MDTKILMPVVIVAIIVGAAAFFGGMKYQESKATTNNVGGQFQRGVRGNFNQAGGLGNRPGGGMVLGEIISSDDKSITVKLDDGSSKIVLLPDNVSVSKTDTGSKTDLKTGVRVGVFGTTNSDGSVSAQNVQLNPMFRLGQRRNMPSPSSK